VINLSNTTPAAPAGGTNITWQQDSSGNVSGYYGIKKQTVTPSSGTITLDATLYSSFFVSVNQALTSITVPSGVIDGQEITIIWVQDASGHAVTLPSNLLGAIAISTTANKRTAQRFSYNSADTNWYATNAGLAGY